MENPCQIGQALLGVVVLSEEVPTGTERAYQYLLEVQPLQGSLNSKPDFGLAFAKVLMLRRHLSGAVVYPWEVAADLFSLSFLTSGERRRDAIQNWIRLSMLVFSCSFEAALFCRGSLLAGKFLHVPICTTKAHRLISAKASVCSSLIS